MGSDSSPSILFSAVLRALEKCKQECSFTLFASQEWIFRLSSLPAYSFLPPDSLKFQLSGDPILMEDEPLFAVKSKKDASLMVGLRFLKRNLVDAFISAGNTGALVSAATLSLKRIPGIYRPALLAALPTKKGPVAIVDVGGTLSCRSGHLIQFAQMGVAYTRCYKAKGIPVVGLLNIGSESMKGSPILQRVHDELRDLARSSIHFGAPSAFEFAGNIEGRDVFEGNVDVLVTDGFTGNVFLKTAEGTAAFILDSLKKVGADVSKLEMLHRNFDYTEHPGAVLCGVDGVIVKCHGNGIESAIFHSIMGAIALVQKNFVEHMKTALLLDKEKNQREDFH